MARIFLVRMWGLGETVSAVTVLRRTPLLYTVYTELLLYTAPSHPSVHTPGVHRTPLRVFTTHPLSGVHRTSGPPVYTTLSGIYTGGWGAVYTEEVGGGVHVEECGVHQGKMCGVHQMCTVLVGVGWCCVHQG